MELKIYDYKLLCNKGSANFNEDIIGLSPYGAWVLDGATGLNNKNLVSNESDAKWYVNWWNKYLHENMKRNDSLKEIMKDGIDEITKEYYKLIGDNKVESLDFPSCACSLVKFYEDKEALFDGLDTTLLSLQTFNGMIKTMKVKKDNMKKSASGGFTNATDVADYLVKKGMPFRNAHEVVGKIVLYCIDNDIAIDDLTIEEFNKFSSIFEEDIYNAIDLLTCVEERSVIGGPSSSSVKIQIEILEKFIKTNKENLSCL